MAQLNEKEARILIERLVPFESLTEVGYGNVFCPFHEDYRRSKSRSARFYFDDDGITRLYCWGEHRYFTSFDYLKLIKNINPFQYLKDNFSEKEIGDYTKIIKDSGLLRNSLRDEELILRIDNAWADSFENVSIFLDSIYDGYKLEDINQ